MKKSKKNRPLQVFLWLFIIGGGLWVVFAPTHHHHAPPPVHVAVQHPPPEPRLKPPLPQESFALPPVGDERAQPQPQPIVPPPPSPLVAPPAPPGHGPRIAIVIDDMGLDLRDSRRAVTLPPFITLSYIPYALRLKEQTREARADGHELLLHMPMEPMGRDDPGPGALLVSLPPDEIRRRFQTALASFGGFDGVNNHMGSRFTADRVGMSIVIDALKQRHLFFFDSRTNSKTVGQALARQQGLPNVARDVFLDDVIAVDAVTAQLAQTERIARHRGYAIAIGHPHPATLQALEAWLPEAEKRGITFVSLNKLVREDSK